MTSTTMRLTLLLTGGLALLAGCSDDEPDAYGNFEATEVVVSAEAGGQLLEFAPDEGDRLEALAMVGLIDTTTPALQRRELVAQQIASRTRTDEATAQIAVLQARLATARDDYERTQRLFRAEAATAGQLNRAEGEVRALEEQIRAARARTSVTREETGTVAARIEQIEEQLRKSRIVNPIAGVVLTTYVEPGEFVQPGQPLYQIADLDTLTLRAYITGDQLASVRIGEQVSVQIDAGGGGLRTLPGRISWIASETEFTPTPIQTRDERAEQVYAVKIRVPNPDGVLKIGMPGELVLPASTERAEP